MEVGARLVAAIAARDWDEIEQSFTQDVRFRALIPPGPIEQLGAVDATATILGWFEGCDHLDLVGSAVSVVGDRLHVWYRLTGTEAGKEFVVEQQVFAGVADDRLSRRQPAVLGLSTTFTSVSNDASIELSRSLIGAAAT